ncbi:type IX secretion system plug protein [Tenacibaculum agarivorans]|uniref:type IX secretion system plug protein n=1 Tax=Tenacibaculum agarivorans TaxID=1908389 RepID=UPI00094BA859|nr:DUF5103 domain-containing protein [Tenacibaculum agarivorans]
MQKILSIYVLFFSVLTNSQDIKSVQLRPVGIESFVSIVPLGTVLQLSFDDLDGDNKEYLYKIEHMTYDWKSSNLQSNQYIDGFDQNYIIDVTNSFNTLQGYTHYRVQIPNQNTRITQSGNYLISVINEDDEIIFTRRCVFYENLTTVGVNVLRSRETKLNNTEQTVQFLVNHKGLHINNPFQEIKVQLFQNNNWNTAISDIQPLFVRNDQLIYNHTLKTNFPGGNEFLGFDNKRVRSTSLNIAKTERKDIFHNYLYTDIERRTKPYAYNPDINGQFIIRTLDANDENSEADYAMIHFSLDVFQSYEGKDVYVYGAFNDFQLTEENKMSFNSEENIYQADILLKQGFYNYTYVTVDQDEKIDRNEINGSFFETENEYTAIIYYKPFGGLFDRVIGVGYGYFDQNR